MGISDDADKIIGKCGSVNKDGPAIRKAKILAEIPAPELTAISIKERDTKTGESVGEIDIIPVEQNIFVLQATEPEKSEGGIVVSAKPKKEFYGTIMAISREVRYGYTYRVGDLVVISPIGGVPVGLGESQFIVVEPDHILAKLERRASTASGEGPLDLTGFPQSQKGSPLEPSCTPTDTGVESPSECSEAASETL